MTSTRSSRSPSGPSSVATASLPSAVLPRHTYFVAAGSGQLTSASPLISECSAVESAPANMISLRDAMPPTLTTVELYEGGVVNSIMTAEYDGDLKLTKFHRAAAEQVSI